jgi:hypothetical protein
MLNILSILGSDVWTWLPLEEISKRTYSLTMEKTRMMLPDYDSV